MRRFAPWWVIAMVVALLVLPPRGAQAADTVTDGGWSYFGDPRAIYANGRTFVGWTTSSGQVQVGSFRKGSSDDVSTVDQVSDPGHANDGPDAIATVDQFGVDDHSNPSLTTTSDGRIVVVYADHAHDQPRWGRLYYRISDRPFDVGSLGPVQSVPGEQLRGDVYRLARWDGRRWIDHPIAQAGGTRADNWYAAGATLDHETPNVVYLARRASQPDASEIETWKTPDGGRTWSSVALTSGSTRDNWRPVSPRGLTGDKTQVWWFAGDYRNYRAFSTKVMVDVGVSLGALGG